ncbi:MAG: CsbD family protein [Steroidobacteraceae bacterium]
MNSDRTAGQWKQIKGSIKEKWGKLTDDEITQLEGHSEKLVGKLQERYGLEREEAEREAREFRTRHDWH